MLFAPYIYPILVLGVPKGIPKKTLLRTWGQMALAVAEGMQRASVRPVRIQPYFVENTVDGRVVSVFLYPAMFCEVPVEQYRKVAEGIGVIVGHTVSTELRRCKVEVFVDDLHPISTRPAATPQRSIVVPIVAPTPKVGQPKRVVQEALL